MSVPDDDVTYPSSDAIERFSEELALLERHTSSVASIQPYIRGEEFRISIIYDVEVFEQGESEDGVPVQEPSTTD